MIAGVDSSGFHPTLAQVQAAYQQGVRVWGKYLPGPGIYSGDTKADFDLLKAGGMVTLAFWSGWADPAQQKALGAAWGVDHICLDVENGIRGDGPWVQPALNVAGGGLYGSPSVFAGRAAEFFIEADYPGFNPQATWIGPAPSIPHGLQWAGSVSAFGGAVDRSWLVNWFAGTQPQGGLLMALSDVQQQQVYDWTNALQKAFFSNVPAGNFSLAQTYLDMLGALKAQVAAMPTGAGGSVDLTQVNAKLDRLIAELHAP